MINVNTSPNQANPGDFRQVSQNTGASPKGNNTSSFVLQGRTEIGPLESLETYIPEESDQNLKSRNKTSSPTLLTPKNQQPSRLNHEKLDSSDIHVEKGNCILSDQVQSSTTLRSILRSGLTTMRPGGVN